LAPSSWVLNWVLFSLDRAGFNGMRWAFVQVILGRQCWSVVPGGQEVGSSNLPSPTINTRSEPVLRGRFFRFHPRGQQPGQQRLRGRQRTASTLALLGQRSSSCCGVQLPVVESGGAICMASSRPQALVLGTRDSLLPWRRRSTRREAARSRGGSWDVLVTTSGMGAARALPVEWSLANGPRLAR
jgi:hypothetical protein